MDIKKVFVVHCKRTGYGVIRSIKNSGYEIYGADTWRTPVSKSKYLKNFFVIPELTEVSDDHFLEHLIRIAKKMDYKKSKPLVFTGSDNYLLFFSKYSEKLKEYFNLSFESDYSKLEEALNKSKVNDIAQSLHISAPKSYKMSGVEDIQKSEFPIIIKPALKSTPQLNVVKEAFRVKVCQNRRELIAAANQLRSLDVDGIIQQYIPGDDSSLYTIGTYSYNGNLIAWSTCSKERQFPPSTGECSFGKTTYVPELLEPAKKLISSLTLTGISQIEFKRYNGDYYLIEINPRIWSWHQIHSDVGVNFIEICLEYLQGNIQDDMILGPDKEEKYWQFFWIDLLHNCMLSKESNFKKIAKDFFKANQEAFFAMDDLAVTWGHTKRTIPYILKKYFKN